MTTAVKQCTGTDREHAFAWTAPRTLTTGETVPGVWTECHVCGAVLPLTTTRIPFHEPEGGDHP